MKNIKEELYEWPAELLVNCIVTTHHKSICMMITEIRQLFGKLVKACGPAHPEILDLQGLYLHCAWKLEAHVAKEEITILPYVRRYSKELKKLHRKGNPCQYSVCPSIHAMYHEHKIENQRFNLLLELFEELKIPDNVHPLTEKIRRKLYELRHLWQMQVDLENDVLFPKIVEMEALLTP